MASTRVRTTIADERASRDSKAILFKAVQDWVASKRPEGVVINAVEDARLTRIHNGSYALIRAWTIGGQDNLVRQFEAEGIPLGGEITRGQTEVADLCLS